MNAYTTFPAAPESILPSLKRTIKALPVTQQIALVQFITEADDFQDFDYADTLRLEDILCKLMRQSVYADHAEDRALHGVEVVR